MPKASRAVMVSGNAVPVVGDGVERLKLAAGPA